MNVKSFIYQFTMLGIAGLLAGCDDGSNEVEMVRSDDGYLVFGSFAGYCQGEACIEIFKIENGRLYEDSRDGYPSSNNLPYAGDFELLSEEKYELVTNMSENFPERLAEEINLVLGMPDAYDQGGIYVELKRNDRIQYWLLDRDISNLPEYLHGWVELVEEKVKLLR